MDGDVLSNQSAEKSCCERGCKNGKRVSKYDEDDSSIQEKGVLSFDADCI